MTTISIVIPIYNEEKNINILVGEIMNIEDINKINDIILVDDNSLDNSKFVISQLEKKNRKIKSFFHNKNLGQSMAIYNGAKQTTSEVIVTLDADLQNNPKDINKLIELYFVDKKTKLVGGIRLHRKDSFTKKISSKFANALRKFILNDDCDDTGCSLKIFDRNIFLSLPFFNGIHRFLPALFKYSGSNNKFIIVDHRSRKYGISNYGTLDRALKGMKDLYKVKKIIKKL